MLQTIWQEIAKGGHDWRETMQETSERILKTPNRSPTEETMYRTLKLCQLFKKTKTFTISCHHDIVPTLVWTSVTLTHKSKAHDKQCHIILLLAQQKTQCP